MKGQHAYKIWYRIKDMAMLNKHLTYKELIREPYYKVSTFYNVYSYTKNKLILLEANYTTDEIVQYFASILFVNPWTKIDDISPYQNNMKNLSFLFHTEPLDFYKYFRTSITSIFLDNLSHSIDDIFCPDNMKNLYPAHLTINQLYVLSKIWPNMIKEKSLYNNLVSNWSTICQFDLNQHIEGSKKIIAKIKNRIENFNVI